LSAVGVENVQIGLSRLPGWSILEEQTELTDRNRERTVVSTVSPMTANLVLPLRTIKNSTRGRGVGNQVHAIVSFT
jgi:hypothetical protein